MTEPVRTTPKDYARSHAVSDEVFNAPQPTPSALNRASSPPGPIRRTLTRVGLTTSRSSLWVPQTVVRYTPILDHGYRSETHGIVLHVNAGWYKGTIGFFTNGQPEPIGSQGVGAHFEIGGHANRYNDVYSDGPPIQFLPLDRVAWHAVEANGYTIGIEHAGFGGPSRGAWTQTHYNVIGQSAYRSAWILHRFNLGPPRMSSTYPGSGNANVWPHSAGGGNWGGHLACPGTGFPWDLWLEYCKKAYNSKWMW